MVGLKFYRFLTSNLKPQVNFSLNLPLLFSVMRDMSPLLFYLKLYIIWTKGTNFRRLTAHVKIRQICTLIGSFCWKYIKFQLKSIEEFCLKTLKSDGIVEEKLICCFRNNMALVNFDLSTKNYLNLQFNWFFLCKVYNIWPKKVQRIYHSWHWRMMLNLIENWITVWKMTWGIWQTFTIVLENIKIRTLMEFFSPKKKMY